MLALFHLVLPADPLFASHAPQLCVQEAELYGRSGRTPLSSGFQMVWPMGSTRGEWRQGGQTLEESFPGSVYVE